LADRSRCRSPALVPSGQGSRLSTLYATALGAYKFHLNGSPVGDQILAPGWMDFREHIPYQVYDVTKQVKRGNNAIAAYLAPGWYSRRPSETAEEKPIKRLSDLELE